MAPLSSHLGNKRRKETRQSVLVFFLSIAALFVILLLVFGFWRWMMPPSASADLSEPLTENLQMKTKQIKSDVEYLANTIGERNMHTTGTMDSSVTFIQERFTSMGYSVENHQYTLQRGIYAGRTASNLIIEIPGSDKNDEIIVIGAHYDTVSGSPGANDNASGVAVLLAAAGELQGTEPDRTIRFIAFANEEPPFFQTADMGSYAYARRSGERGEKIAAMIALDGLGYYDTSPGSQSYPLPGLGFAYSNRADFIGLVTRLSDLSLLRKISAGFKDAGVIPTESAALPGFLPGVNWSDHWSFWKHGYPGMLITDTLLFRDPHYHTPGDTPERLNYQNMGRITTALVSTIEKLAFHGD